MYTIHLLPALFGDSILIEYGEKSSPKFILIDGGPYYGFEDMTQALKKVAPKLKTLELLVITHIDIDHIDGIITLLNQPKLPYAIKEVWFNGWDQLKDIKSGLMGALQGEYLSDLIKKWRIKHNTSFNGKAVMVDDPNKLPVVTLTGGMKLTLLSPHLDALKKLKNTWSTEIKALKDVKSIEKRWQAETRYSRAMGVLGGKPPHPDVSIPNASSIAFIADYKGTTCLFAGDTMSAELLKSIEPMCKKQKVDRLKVNAWKLAHHGSKKSTLPSIMKKMNAKNIFISSNGSRYQHPDAECIQSLLENSDKGLELHFNYLSPQNKVWQTAVKQKKFGFTAKYPKAKFGISVPLK